MAVTPTPLYAASKAAISSFARSLASLEPAMNVRVNAVAPGITKTPIWTEDKIRWFDEGTDTWVTPQRIAEVMLELIQNPEYVGGTVLEVGSESVRKVEALNDPGNQSAKGHTVGKIADGFAETFTTIESQFGK